MAGIPVGRLALIVAGLGVLTACADGGAGLFGAGRGGGEGARPAAETGAVRLVERDVEAPEVFQVTDEGLWDGRPSLGGVWVAHPDVAEPQRVIIRNEANGQFVIGALFRREREMPGPAFQVSSDAAAALGMLAGAPARLNVTALRREEVPIAEEAGQPGDAVETAALPEPGSGRSGRSGAAASASDGTGSDAASDAAGDAAVASARVAPPRRPAQAPAGGAAGGKPYIQLGLFSVEENARRLADQLRARGIIPLIRQGSASGKTYWRVLVGPAETGAERAALMKKVKAMGFADAYFVSS